MSLLRRVLWHTDDLLQKAASLWWLHRFQMLDGPLHRRLEIGQDNLFSVPVRGGGSGSLQIGAHNHLGFRPAARFGSGEILLQARDPAARIVIGNANRLSNNVSIVANVEIVIGDRCLIGEQVSIYDSDFHEIDPATRGRGFGPAHPVSIGNNVWLGSRVMVLKGVSIGDNTVVGAMSLVTRSLPPNCVAFGIPAKVHSRP